MDPKHPISLQTSKTIAPLKMADYTIENEKHKEKVEIELIEGLDSDAQEASDLADQWSKSNQHITISGGYQRLPHKYSDNDQCG